MNTRTLERAHKALKKQGPLTVQAMADHLGVMPGEARQYMTLLANRKMAKPEFRSNGIGKKVTQVWVTNPKFSF